MELECRTVIVVGCSSAEAAACGLVDLLVLVLVAQGLAAHLEHSLRR